MSLALLNLGGGWADQELALVRATMAVSTGVD